jgi:O-antigen/teichoic acid export membrane protein
LIRRSDDLLIGYYLGPTLLGFYTIGYQLLLVIIRLVTEVTNSVAFPTFSRIQNEPERMRRAFYSVTQYTSLFAFPVFIGLACFGTGNTSRLFLVKNGCLVSPFMQGSIIDRYSSVGSVL